MFDIIPTVTIRTISFINEIFLINRSKQNSSAMNESIYNLVPREYVPAERQTMHKSSFDPKAQLTGSTFGAFRSLSFLSMTINFDLYF